MISLEQLTELLGWAALINIAYLCLATLCVTLLNGPMTKLHTKLFPISPALINEKYFDFLSYYKIVSLVFIISPYIALKIMGY